MEAACERAPPPPRHDYGNVIPRLWSKHGWCTLVYDDWMGCRGRGRLLFWLLLVFFAIVECSSCAARFIGRR